MPGLQRSFLIHCASLAAIFFCDVVGLKVLQHIWLGRQVGKKSSTRLWAHVLCAKNSLFSNRLGADVMDAFISGMLGAPAHRTLATGETIPAVGG